jgi:hypothetical protein
MHERWSEIYQLLETYLALLTALFSGFSLFLVYKGYLLANQYKDQQKELKNLEELISIRRALYQDIKSMEEKFKIFYFLGYEYEELINPTSSQQSATSSSGNYISGMLPLPDFQFVPIIKNRYRKVYLDIKNLESEIEFNILFVSFPEISEQLSLLKNEITLWVKVYKNGEFITPIMSFESGTEDEFNDHRLAQHAAAREVRKLFESDNRELIFSILQNLMSLLIDLSKPIKRQ